jgi:hypothetical protein
VTIFLVINQVFVDVALAALLVLAVKGVGQGDWLKLTLPPWLKSIHDLLTLRDDPPPPLEPHMEPRKAAAKAAVAASEKTGRPVDPWVERRAIDGLLTGERHPMVGTPLTAEQALALVRILGGPRRKGQQ